MSRQDLFSQDLVGGKVGLNVLGALRVAGIVWPRHQIVSVVGHFVLFGGALFAVCKGDVPVGFGVLLAPVVESMNRFGSSISPKLWLSILHVGEQNSAHRCAMCVFLIYHCSKRPLMQHFYLQVVVPNHS